MPANQPASVDPLERILCLFLSSRRNIDVIEHLRDEIQDGVDWKAFIRMAQAERVESIVYQQGNKFNLLPEPQMQELKQIYFGQMRRSMLMQNELEQALLLLNEAGICPVVLKGAALGPLIYQNCALRPLGDLDLLVRFEDRDRTIDLMKRGGYEQAELETAPGTILEEENVFAAKRPGNHATVELHWGLLHPPTFQKALVEDWLWETAQEVQFGKSKGLLLGPEAQLIHLCSHLCLHHAGKGLLWFNDIAEILALYQAQIDWQIVFEKAAQNEVVYSLQFVLPWVKQNLGASIPDGVMEKLLRMKPTEREEEMFQRFMDKDKSAAERTWDWAVSETGWRQKFYYLFHSAFPTPGYMQARYRISHPLLVPLYYPYRWWIGLRRR